MPKQQYEAYRSFEIADEREYGAGQKAILADESRSRLAAWGAYAPVPRRIPTAEAIKFVAVLHQQRRASISRVLLDGVAVEAKARAAAANFTAARQASLNQFRTTVTTDVSRTNALDLSGLMISETETTVGGTYALTDLPEGTYCIHAELNLPGAFAEWAMPIQVAAGATTKVDFSNKNALLVLGGK
jgi:hypothetical protein